MEEDVGGGALTVIPAQAGTQGRGAAAPSLREALGSRLRGNDTLQRSPGTGYAEFAGWVPGGRQVLVACEVRAEGGIGAATTW